jgi:hypothetical protein
VGSYTVTLDARQEAAIADAAAQLGATPQDVVNGELARALARLVAAYDQVDARAVAQAYQDATPARRAAVRTALGL